MSDKCASCLDISSESAKSGSGASFSVHYSCLCSSDWATAVRIVEGNILTDFPMINCGKKTPPVQLGSKLREGFKKKTDYLVTLIIFPLTPTHLPPIMTYDKND